MLVVSPNWTIDEVVLKKSDIAGSVGRYMSVTKGPNAVSIPKKTSIKVLEFLFCLIMNCLVLFGAKVRYIFLTKCFVLKIIV